MFYFSEFLTVFLQHSFLNTSFIIPSDIFPEIFSRVPPQIPASFSEISSAVLYGIVEIVRSVVLPARQAHKRLENPQNNSERKRSKTS